VLQVLLNQSAASLVLVVGFNEQPLTNGRVLRTHLRRMAHSHYAAGISIIDRGVMGDMASSFLQVYFELDIIDVVRSCAQVAPKNIYKSIQ
jgi:hypothetical protein